MSCKESRKTSAPVGLPSPYGSRKRGISSSHNPAARENTEFCTHSERPKTPFFNQQVENRQFDSIIEIIFLKGNQDCKPNYSDIQTLKSQQLFRYRRESLLLVPAGTKGCNRNLDTTPFSSQASPVGSPHTSHHPKG